MAAPAFVVPARRRRGSAPAIGLVLAAAGIALALAWPYGGTARGAAPDSVTILGGAATTLDPAAQGDVASAAVTAQIYESLTAFDPGLVLRPALAASWDAAPGGRRVVFHLRPNLTFSDGTPLTAADVVHSWLRVIDPRAPSPLASLLADVVGASAFLRGSSADPSTVGLRANGSDVEVDLVQPAADLAAILASPTFGVVPSSGALDGRVGSGGYVVTATSATELTLTANPRYWAGRPAIGTVHLLTTLGGRSPVDAFTAGTVDYTPIDDTDAAWIAYDQALGPSLRSVPSLSVEYLGFDVRQHPFDDVRVRQAFALAVDWARLVTLASTGTSVPATSMVPPGIPGRPPGNFSELADPATARQLLAAAGYPGGRGFPSVTYLSGGTPIDEGIVRQLHDVLGVTIGYETMDFSAYFARLASAPPAIWSLGWSADYPGPNDFLGLLLGTGQANNYGHWSSATFDAAIAAAGTATDVAAAVDAYARAAAIVHDAAPVIPISYGSGWALSRSGLLGAADGGVGFIRFAGLAWAP
ncbi:MAG: peptide ABC transporter substrate-binding protein [Candidatus Limnocylindrales bacterium]